MIQVECPFCGKRNLTEFSYGGQAHISRPENMETVSDAEFARYLFARKTPKGHIRKDGITLWAVAAGSMRCAIR